MAFHAEPTTFGLKLADILCRIRIVACGRGRRRDEIATCAISGAVGTFAHIDPFGRGSMLPKNGAACREPVSTQVIPRDRHAMFFATLGVVAAVRLNGWPLKSAHLQRTEVREAEEFFSAGQKGSSAMPHKRNPVLTENRQALPRIVRAAVTPALGKCCALA